MICMFLVPLYGLSERLRIDTTKARVGFEYSRAPGYERSTTQLPRPVLKVRQRSTSV